VRFPTRNRCALVAALATTLGATSLVRGEDIRRDSSSAAPLVDGALSRLESGASRLLGLWSQPPTSPAISAPADDSTSASELPTTLISIRLAHALVRQGFERQIDMESPVVDEILGTRLSGRARTLGATKLLLETQSDRIIATIVFSGTINMKTRGTNGPVVLHSTGQTNFQATKRIIVSDCGMTIEPAQATAETSCTTDRVEGSLPGLRGRIAERLAWRQVGETQMQVDDIAARHAEDQLERELNSEVDRAVALGAKDLHRHLVRLVALEGQTPRLRFTSTPSHLQISVESGRPSPDAVEQVLTAAAEDDFDISARIHRVVVQRALADADFRKLLPLLVSQFLPAQTGRGQTTAIPVGVSTARPTMSWSSDGNWMLIQYKAPSSAPQPAVSADSRPVAEQLPLAGVRGQ
jgi:hypothetical protein